MSSAIGAEIVSVFFEHYPQVKLHLVDGLSGFVNRNGLRRAESIWL